MVARDRPPVFFLPVMKGYLAWAVLAVLGGLGQPHGAAPTVQPIYLLSIIYSLLSIIFFFFPMPVREGENKPDMSTYYKITKFSYIYFIFSEHFIGDLCRLC